MDLLREQALKIVNNRSNEIIKEFIEHRFNFKNVTKSQFATLEGILENRNFNLESNRIEEFILEKLQKLKSEEFFKDILKNYVGKSEEILVFLNSSQEEQQVKNQIFKEIFYLIKISFRKENALEILDI
ncbi:hypothetical protein SAMN02745174_01627 [Cetobacterium ceti]|uniref:Uncharacterized protein n=1 Tax=Cetobacterium ceti TaxID=180163 RepID=A0A1T4NQA9_9FUSO|nr:hypothetical protein [Cetobacterium ceti]SJZ81404.1 hypothetical protein SAMN02745174_01627 [Cetobacterium ceti]